MIRPASALAALLLALPAAGQATPASIQERVRADSDTTQSYALYLPPGWSPQRRWPVLLLADPAGRAGVPLERFREAAGRHGWVLLSGWGTLANHDSADAATGRALDAMLRDARGRWAADPRRVYLAGFSGTARIGWEVVTGSPGVFAGLIMVGAGPSRPPLLARLQLERMRPIPVLAAAGDEDFNHSEVEEMAFLLAAAGYPSRVVSFAGGHAWPPPDPAGEAIAWLELQAVRDRKAMRPEAWVDSIFAAGMASAGRLEGADPAAAAAALRALAADFGGLRDTAGLGERAAALDREPAAVRALRSRAGSRRAEREFRPLLQRWLARARTLPAARLRDDARRSLGLRRLQAAAAGHVDPEQRRSAARRLGLLRFWAGFAEPAQAAARGDHPRAAAWLALAREIHEDASVCAALARAHVRAGDPAAASEPLACALRLGAGLADDPLLAPLLP